MKRIKTLFASGKQIQKILFVTAMILAITFSACGEAFTANSAYDARMKALPVFQTCALSAEYPESSTQKGHVLRWERSIHIYVSGNPTKQDLKTLNSFLMELALRVPDMPNISITEEEDKANMHIYYVKLAEMDKYIPNYVKGNWGMFHYSYNTYRLKEAWIGIATDVTNQRSRNHLIKEEIVGALGLFNDHNVYDDSILYQKWTTVQDLSELDWIMLNMLYSPLIKPGDNAETIEKTFTQAWSK